MIDTLYLLTAFDGTGNNRSVDIPNDTTIDQIKIYPASRLFFRMFFSPLKKISEIK